MTRLGQRWRVLFSTALYLVVVVTVVGGAFFATLSLAPSPSLADGPVAAATLKIGPGYGKMHPPDLGKPEKAIYSSPYYSRSAVQDGARAKQPAPTKTAVQRVI